MDKFDEIRAKNIWVYKVIPIDYKVELDAQINQGIAHTAKDIFDELDKHKVVFCEDCGIVMPDSEHSADHTFNTRYQINNKTIQELKAQYNIR